VFLTSRPLDYWLLWVVALASLALNVFLINTLLSARRQVAEAVGVVAQGLGQLRSARFTYQVHIEQTVPVNLSVPISDTIRVPIATTVPLKTTLQVPIELPLLGTRIINVPVQTTIPVNLEVEVPVDLTVPIAATVPVVFDVPVEIALAGTPLDTALAGSQGYLEELAAELGTSLLVQPTPAPTPQ